MDRIEVGVESCFGPTVQPAHRTGTLAGYSIRWEYREVFAGSRPAVNRAFVQRRDFACVRSDEVAIEVGMAERTAGIAEDKRLDFRIGINVGDIIIDGDDIFGDGVNVAARVESLAEPGGICVSRVVRDQVLDKLDFTFEDLGPQQVKNIVRPVEVYRVDLGGKPSQVPGVPRAT